MNKKFKHILTLQPPVKYYTCSQCGVRLIGWQMIEHLRKCSIREDLF